MSFFDDDIINDGIDGMPFPDGELINDGIDGLPFQGCDRESFHEQTQQQCATNNKVFSKVRNFFRRK